MSISSLSKLAEEVEEFRKRLRESAQPIVLAAAKELFDQHPVLQALRWHQYAPSFNDGDPCVFHVNDVYVKIAPGPNATSDVEEAGDYENGFLSTWDLTYSSTVTDYDLNIEVTKPLSDAVREFSHGLSAIEQALEAALGASQEITIERTESGDIVLTNEDYDCGH